MHVSEVSQNIAILFHRINVVAKTQSYFKKSDKIEWHFLFERKDQQNLPGVCNARNTQLVQLLSQLSALSSGIWGNVCLQLRMWEKSFPALHTHVFLPILPGSRKTTSE